MAKKKLLFIPGYLGSTLIDRDTKENRWVRISDFFSNKYDLRMTESYSDLPIRNNLVDDAILLKVKLIPKIVEIESYDKTLKHLSKFCAENERELHLVTYDWRDDFHESITKIGNKINELTADGEKIDIVAHSNGGLLISYYLRYGVLDFFEAIENWEGITKINKVSIIASPLKGAFSLFKHLKDGSAVLKNRNLLGSLDYTSFRSTYFFLPPKQFHKGYLLKRGEDFKEFNLFDALLWKENKWGPYINHHNNEMPVNDDKFQKLLKRAEKFQELQNAEVVNQPKSSIDIQVIQAIGKNTFFYPTFLTNESTQKYHYPKFDKIDGDGIVAGIAAGPYDWFSLFNLDYQIVKAEHLKVISDYQHQKIVHSFLKT